MHRVLAPWSTFPSPALSKDLLPLPDHMGGGEEPTLNSSGGSALRLTAGEQRGVASRTVLDPIRWPDSRLGPGCGHAEPPWCLLSYLHLALGPALSLLLRPHLESYYLGQDPREGGGEGGQWGLSGEGGDVP